ncbi:hypothetical protein SUDANB120_04967 [Streptomyces sp. enrichment culture]|uniref:hypothetical protein n=1 Tax=Streptomyces sp. enrichment culture TaxID=1795815 RepID=UPI003F55F3E9
MESYTVQAHRYGSVAVVTLCAAAHRVDGAVCRDRLLRVLSGIGPGVGCLVLDLDRAPSPAPADALAAVDTWAGGRRITVVALTPSAHAAGTPRPGGVALRPAAAGAARGTPGSRAEEAAPARQLRRVLGVRVLVFRAAGIRQARTGAHPCS